jgi:hypothetical protein
MQAHPHMRAFTHTHTHTHTHTRARMHMHTHTNAVCSPRLICGSVEAVSSLIDATNPGYYLFNLRKRVFIYCCPESSARKDRMVYSTTKSHMAQVLQVGGSAFVCVLEPPPPHTHTPLSLSLFSLSVNKACQVPHALCLCLSPDARRPQRRWTSSSNSLTHAISPRTCFWCAAACLPACLPACMHACASISGFAPHPGAGQAAKGAQGGTGPDHRQARHRRAIQGLSTSNAPSPARSHALLSHR